MINSFLPRDAMLRTVYAVVVCVCVCVCHTPVLYQEALLSQRDRATRLSVEILQLQNIAICMILRLAVFTQYRSVTDTHTDRRTDRYTTTACTALSIALRGKNRPYCTAHQV